MLKSTPEKIPCELVIEIHMSIIHTGPWSVLSLQSETQPSGNTLEENTTCWFGLGSG